MPIDNDDDSRTVRVVRHPHKHDEQSCYLGFSCTRSGSQQRSQSLLLVLQGLAAMPPERPHDDADGRWCPHVTRQVPAAHPQQPRGTQSGPARGWC